MHQVKIDEIGRQLQEMSTQAILRSSLIAGKLGINLTDLECLEVLMRLGRTTAGGLSAETGLSTGGITKMIDRLEKAGLVNREFDKSDRRKVFIVLDRAQVDQQVFPFYESLSASMNQVLTHYSPEELALISGFLADSLKVSGEDLQQLAEL